jgi:hypothetical protein
MAYFGDATKAHATDPAGVARRLLFSLSGPLGVLIVTLAMGLLVRVLSGRTITPDSCLVLSHGSLARWVW